MATGCNQLYQERARERRCTLNERSTATLDDGQTRWNSSTGFFQQCRVSTHPNDLLRSSTTLHQSGLQTGRASIAHGMLRRLQQTITAHSFLPPSFTRPQRAQGSTVLFDLNGTNITTGVYTARTGSEPSSRACRANRENPLQRPSQRCKEARKTSGLGGRSSNRNPGRAGAGSR